MDEIGQYNYPQWDKFEEMAKGIFDREYYTNHGPLAIEFEKQLEGKLEVKHAVCMSNTGIGTMIAIKALDIKGCILVPSFGEHLIFQSLIWSGLTPIYLPVDDTFHLNINLIPKELNSKSEAIVVINNFGNTSNIEAIVDFAYRNKKKLIFVSTDSIIQTFQGTKYGNFGDLEIFSLSEKYLLNAIDACVITTNSDFIASRLRNIRSSYGAGKIVSIPFTGNGRMSEIQAGMGLLSLDEISNNINRNRGNFNKIVEVIKGNDSYILPEFDQRIGDQNYQRMVLKLSNKGKNIKHELLNRLKINDTMANYSYNPLNKESITKTNDFCSGKLIEIPLSKLSDSFLYNLSV